MVPTANEDGPARRAKLDRRGAERLLKLADFLEAVPRKNFEMGTFGTAIDETAPVKRFSGEFDCGFAGCAMGWAAHGRVVKGLKYAVDSDVFSYGSHEYGDGFEAASVVFGVVYQDAIDLFKYRGPETPREVAKRIRAFVRSRA